MSRPNAGFTLIETMVACALMVVATGLLASFFSYFTRQSLRYHTRQELATQAERVLFRVQSTLSGASASSVVAVETIAGVRFPTAQVQGQGSLVFDKEGALMWQTWQVYGFDKRLGRVWEARQALATPTKDLQSLSKGPAVPVESWPRRTLALKVTNFQISGPVNKAFRVQVALTDEYGYRLELASSVVAHN